MPTMQKIASLDDLNYHHTLMAGVGTVLVYFTAPDCGACRALKAALQVLLQADEGIEVYEVDAVHNSALVNEFEVFHLPALFLYQDGVFHAELLCPPLPESIRQTIESVLDKPAEEEP